LAIVPHRKAAELFNRKLVDMNYFIQTQSVALTLFGIMAGVILRITGRYKRLLVAGLAIRLL
jgi:hypothetical protein